MRQVIQGLEEGLQSIAEALEGGGGSSIVPTPAAADEGKVLTAGDDGTASWEDAGSGIPTPTLNDEGKVLRAVPQTQTTVAPEWAPINEVPIGGQNGQILTKNSNGYGWANAPTPEKELPSIGSSDSGKLLQAWYDSDEGYGYTSWGTVASVPSSNASDNGKVLTCTGRNAYGWAPASGGGGHIDVLKIDVNKSDFFASEGASGMYDASVFVSGALTKIDNMIGITIVDNVDSGNPVLITPKDENDCSIFYDSDYTIVRISSAIYNSLGTRQATHFYMTYYTGA